MSSDDMHHEWYGKRGWEDKKIEIGGYSDKPNNTLGYPYDYAIVIGRFEPPHLGHVHLFRKAFEVGQKVIILCGSDHRPMDLKNPWSVQDRDRMITMLIESELNIQPSRFEIVGIRDFPYNDQKWALNVNKKVDKIIHNDIFFKSNAVLVGYHKDDSSFYLDMFPQWGYIEVDQEGPISATEVRELYWQSTEENFYKIANRVLNKSTLSFLLQWRNTEKYSYLVEEFKEIQTKYKDPWKFSPYTPTFNASDAVVLESAHVLLIKRAKAPGKDLWALPGGHIEPNERMFDCCIRELIEETKIDCPEKIIRGSVRIKNHLFDKPDRDPRGRYFSHASLIILPSRAGKISKVKGADDANEARWFPLAGLEDMSHLIFSDHYDVIDTLIGMV